MLISYYFFGNITVIYSINVTDGQKAMPGMNLPSPALVLSAAGMLLIRPLRVIKIVPMKTMILMDFSVFGVF